MNIQLIQIDRTNYNECIALKVGEEQNHFVAPNIVSLVQAAYEPDLYPLGVYLDNKMVGFILYDFDKELNGWSFSRFMIDQRYQKRGIGTKVLERFLEYFYSKYKDEALYTSAEVDNLRAIKLYESYGFEKLNVFSYENDGHTYTEVRMIKHV